MSRFIGRRTPRLADAVDNAHQHIAEERAELNLDERHVVALERIAAALETVVEQAEAIGGAVRARIEGDHTEHAIRSLSSELEDAADRVAAPLASIADRVGRLEDTVARSYRR